MHDLSHLLPQSNIVLLVLVIYVVIQSILSLVAAVFSAFVMLKRQAYVLSGEFEGAPKVSVASFMFIMGSAFLHAILNALVALMTYNEFSHDAGWPVLRWVLAYMLFSHILGLLTKPLNMRIKRKIHMFNEHVNQVAKEKFAPKDNS